ncbi:MAG: hypothetical protein ACRENM_06770 [Candidatus Dormibacteraceae bacterium]
MSTPPRFPRSMALAILILLALQFLFGMVVNLFVTIPKHHPGSNPPEYFGGVVRSVDWAILQGPRWLTAHALLGLLLLLMAIILLVFGARSGRSSLLWTGILGLVGVLGAGFNGGSFLNYHEDFSSMLMSGGFALAVGSYATMLFVSALERLRAESARVLAA